MELCIKGEAAMLSTMVLSICIGVIRIGLILLICCVMLANLISFIVSCYYEGEENVHRDEV